jgi:glycerol uptake facilitator-like aquaporin
VTDRVSSPSLPRRSLAEFIGTALLTTAVIGSGVAAARLSPGNTGLELFENAAATAAALVAIIFAVGAVSGAHLNPVITLLEQAFGGIRRRDAAFYVTAQVSGAIGGAVVANVMFGLGAASWSHHARSGSGLWVGEVVATFGLALVVFGVVRSGHGSFAPFAVGAYIGAAYFFTSSTSFANPAVAVGRMFSDSFAGIAPKSVPAFVGFELAGGVLAALTIAVLYPDASDVAPKLVLPAPENRTEEVVG